MNRNDEFAAMIEELNQPVPTLADTLNRAYRRKRKRTAKMIVRPVAGLVACFAVFVMLVNFCAPVAYACAQIPVLRELAEAVTFSKSLTDAVENEYAQSMDLIQTKNEITAEISYLIVDQKQVNVFYSLNSDKYEQLEADPEVLNTDGVRPPSCGYHSSGFGAENGELRCLSIDFVEDNVPDSLRVELKVYSNGIRPENEAPDRAVEDIYSDTAFDAPDYIATFDFLLEFDPKFTASGKIFPVNQTVMLEGQAVTVTDIEVYPTHMRVDIEEAEDNTAWLKGLEFYIQTDWGMKFDPVSNGIVSTGTGESPSMVSYRADSTYFYEAKNLKLVITGAKWLRKDMQTTYLNLATGEHGELPEGVEFDSARKQGSGWVVKFRAPLEEDRAMYQLFGHEFFDADGNAYEINQWSSLYGDEDGEGNITYFYDEFPLQNFSYDEVWLSPQYSHQWIAEDEIVVTVQQKVKERETLCRESQGIESPLFDGFIPPDFLPDTFPESLSHSLPAPYRGVFYSRRRFLPLG